MTQELRKLAEAATQGKWKSSGFSVNSKEHGWATIANTEFDYDGMAENAAYIAAANPAAILALLDRVEKAEKDAERYRWLRSPDTDVSLVIDKRTGWVPPDEHVEGVGGYHTYEYRAGEELDAALDSAMEASK